IELDEDPFAMDLIRGNPIWLATRKAGHLRALVRIARLLGCFDAGESQQGVDLAQSLQQKHSADLLLEAGWRGNLLAHEMRVVDRRIGRSQHFPLWPLDVGFTDRVLTAAIAMGFDGRPDLRRRVLVDARQGS